MEAFLNLFSIHSATSLARQLALRDYLGQHNWQLNLKVGTVDFGGGRLYPIQLLGSESHYENTWLWAWANKQSRLPRRILKSVKIIRRFGREHNLSEFTDPYFPLNRLVNGHTIAMISSGIIENSCYYRGPYDEGAAFFLVMDAPQTIFEPVDPPRVLFIIQNLIAEFPVVNHRVMIEHFLQDQGFTLDTSDRALSATRLDGGVVMVTIDVTFDSQGRMKKIGSRMKRVE